MTVSGLRYKALRAERHLMRLQKLWRRLTNPSSKTYFYHRVSEYREFFKAIADEKGARLNVLSDDFWEFEIDGAKTRILNHQLEFDNPVILGLASRKPLVHRLLREAGLAVPEHIVFALNDLDTAYDFLAGHPKGCVIKPANGTHAGDGVTTHILTRKETRKAAVLASLYSYEILMEPQVPGECYRLLVIGGTVAHAVRRSGPRLTGNGQRTVSELVSVENRRLEAMNEPALTIDRDSTFTLSWQGLRPDSIPGPGQRFLLKSINDPEGTKTEVRTVYNEDVTGLVCESIKKSAETAAWVIGSDFLGVDIITVDPERPLEETGGIINEVNTTPALHHHYDHRREKYPAPAVRALDLLLKKCPSVAKKTALK